MEIPVFDSDCLAPSAQPTSTLERTYIYLDLRPFENLHLPCGLQAIIVRDTFIELYKFLKEPPEGEKRLLQNGCILSGHPGIGITS